MKSIELFCGAGGMTEGFRKAGIECLLAADVDPQAIETFSYNHPTIKTWCGDIRNLTESIIADYVGNQKVDIISGGPPCQGFSLAGLRIPEDPKNKLFLEYFRIVKIVKPRAIIFENVSGILSMQKGAVVCAIENQFKSIGYKITYKVVNSAEYGVPQSRPRFILLGFLDNIEASFPKITHSKREQITKKTLDLFEETDLKTFISVYDALSNLPSVEQGEGSEVLESLSPKNDYQKYIYGEREPGKVFNHRATRHSQLIVERYKMIKPGETNASLPEHLRTKKINVFRLSTDAPSRTVTCNFRTDLLHPWIPRGLTVREAARLQSFDDDYRFFGNLTRKAKWVTQDDQVGNAVPPLLAKAFADHIKKVLNSMPDTASYGHKVGQVIGDWYEEYVALRILKQVANSLNLYLDHRFNDRSARKSNKILWSDLENNTVDYDFVLEIGGTDSHIGLPVAFFETFWRRGSRHSKDKARDDSGKLVPMSLTFPTVRMLGIISAGDFSEPAKDLVNSRGIDLFYISKDQIVSAWVSKGKIIDYDDKASEEEKQKISEKIDLDLDYSLKNDIASALIQNIGDHVFIGYIDRVKGYLSAMPSQFEICFQQNSKPYVFENSKIASDFFNADHLTIDWGQDTYVKYKLIFSDGRIFERENLTLPQVIKMHKQMEQLEAHMNSIYRKGIYITAL